MTLTPSPMPMPINPDAIAPPDGPAIAITRERIDKLLSSCLSPP